MSDELNIILAAVIGFGIFIPSFSWLIWHYEKPNSTGG